VDSKYHLTDTNKTRIQKLIFKGLSLFFFGLFVGILCHILAIDLLFGPISIQIIPLPAPISEGWAYLAGPGIIPFSMVTGGVLITVLAFLQLYRNLFEAIDISKKLSPKAMLFAKILFLALVFFGLFQGFGVSLRIAWQSLFS